MRAGLLRGGDVASYAIGDIQGCYDELADLLAEVAFDPTCDCLYLVGDLVNRGPKSLETLRWVYQHRQSVRVVLGNHDLHLLAVYAGVAKSKGRDTLDAVLAAPDVGELLVWLRHQPLVARSGAFLFVHAGLSPSWTCSQALKYSKEVEVALQRDNYADFLTQMYGNKPVKWSNDLVGWDRLRYIVNACTRMRVLRRDGSLDLAYKGELDDAPEDVLAWFDARAVDNEDEVVVCGHWSALGLRMSANIIALDTGCVWGGCLTAVRLEDRAIFQVPSRQPICEDWN